MRRMEVVGFNIGLLGVLVLTAVLFVAAPF